MSYASTLAILMKRNGLKENDGGLRDLDLQEFAQAGEKPVPGLSTPA
jgi:hypothetical protein